jgi:uncharacterized protein with HEPN domain
MDERVEKWLVDIKMSIEEIDSFFVGRDMVFNDFKGNILLKRAIERNLTIIGEAVRRILDKEPDIKIENARNIVNLRNYVVHSYDNVTDEMIWGILIKHLPLLKAEIKIILKQANFKCKTS